ncbi:MAG: zf-TFIIB domain-containing protein [Deltaproteobacteria bacterium]|nr:zf-TFIIB domain-containing protein [Deltaproteobacteria bacterium]
MKSAHMHNKHFTPEEQYFAQEEIEKLKKLADDKKSKISANEEQKLKQLHWMRCAKCGHELHEMFFHGYTIDKCFHCGGVFLDNTDLKKMIGEESGLLKAILSLFKLS